MEKLNKIDEDDVDKLLWSNNSPHGIQQSMRHDNGLSDECPALSEDSDADKSYQSPTFAEKCHAKMLFGKSRDKSPRPRYHESMIHDESPPISEFAEISKRMILRSTTTTTYARAANAEEMSHNVSAYLNASSVGIRAPSPYISIIPGAKMEVKSLNGQPILVDAQLPVPPNISQIHQLYAQMINNETSSTDGIFSSVSNAVNDDIQLSGDYYRKVRESRFIDWEDTTWVTYKEGDVLGSKSRSMKPRSRLAVFAKEYYPDGVPLETIAYYKELNYRRKNAVNGKLDMKGFEEKLKGKFESKERGNKSPVPFNTEQFSCGRGLDLSSRGGGIGRMKDSDWGRSSPVATICTLLSRESRFGGMGSTSPDLFSECNNFDDDMHIYDFDDERDDPTYLEDDSKKLPKLPKNTARKSSINRGRGRARN